MLSAVLVHRDGRGGRRVVREGEAVHRNLHHVVEALEDLRLDPQPLVTNDQKGFFREGVLVEPVRIVRLLEAHDTPAFFLPFFQKFRGERPVLLDFQVDARFTCDFGIDAGVSAANDLPNAAAPGRPDDSRKVHIAVHWRDRNDQLARMLKLERVFVTDLNKFLRHFNQFSN